MAFKEVEPSDPITIDNILAVIYGDPGAGKSSLGFTTDNPITFNWDHGLGRVVNRGRSVEFEHWQDCLDYVEGDKFKKQVAEGKVKTIINDTGGTMLDDYLKHHIIKIGGKGVVDAFGGLGLKGYGIMKDSFDRYYNKCKELKVDMVFICHATMDDDGENKRFFPKMTGGSRDILIQKADLIGYMEISGDKITLDFNPTSRHFGKNCAGIQRLEIPDFKAKEYQGILASLMDRTKTHMNRIGEAQAAALKLVDDFREKITNAGSIEELEALRPGIAELSELHQKQVYYFYAKQFAEMWAVTNIDVANTKTPEQFQELSDKIAALPKEVSGELREAFKKMLDAAGLKYDNVARKYIDKNATPAPAPKEEPKKEEPKAIETVKTDTPKEKVLRDEGWFMERLGKRVNYLLDGKTTVVLVENENTVYHMYGVMQKIKKGEFSDLEPTPAEKSAAAVTV